jgi:hypothetical protein
VNALSPHLRRAGGAVLGVLLLAAPGAADEVLLVGGGRVSGVIVERTAREVVVEAGPGRVAVAMSRVVSIVEGRSLLQELQERADRIAPDDSRAWAELARWAEDHDLLTQSQEMWHRVVRLDPSHPEANAALGRVQLNGAWMDADDAYRARGLVRYEDRWVTPGERETLVRQQAFEETAARARQEAEWRVREAEARAREAEARAEEAEAAAAASEAPAEGIPLWWGVGGVALPPSGPGVSHSGHPGQKPHPRPHGEPDGGGTRPRPDPSPPPSLKPSSPGPADRAAPRPLGPPSQAKPRQN